MSNGMIKPAGQFARLRTLGFEPGLYLRISNRWSYINTGNIKSSVSEELKCSSSMTASDIPKSFANCLEASDKVVLSFH